MENSISENVISENLILVKPDAKYSQEILAYKKEFENSTDRMNGAGGLEKYDDPIKWIELCRLLEKQETCPPDRVESDQYMLVRAGDGKVLGMINFRHWLNEYLAEYGGHIGYSVRKSERLKGYAKKMLGLCLQRCRQAGLSKVLLTCMSGNEGSRKTILGAGGVYERTTRLDSEDVDMERYWIYLDPLEKYYNRYNENNRLLTRSGSVEFLTTMRYIKRFIKPGARILDIGAGTGRYSLRLADEGYQVDAVELIEHNIEIFKSQIKPDHRISVKQGNVLDLSSIADNSYDIVLLLGPMYHLYNTADKRRALEETLRVTKPGGVMFAAYCIQEASIIQYGFEGRHMPEIFEKKLLDPETFKVISDPSEIFELYRREDIDTLMETLGAKRLHYVAADLYTQYMRSTVDAMDDVTFECYLNYHYSICERNDLTGLTNHSLDIWKKN
ncbi:MAG: bifunctional GNAT family N-acetyltransferase/class I SAM-dependent methyltransferase [Treponema sp.]|nr:bifunctional GNAT family N-acetyltransferase/class I SAM-dependent methyltransferase [Treponema sp.]